MARSSITRKLRQSPRAHPTYPHPSPSRIPCLPPVAFLFFSNPTPPPLPDPPSSVRRPHHPASCKSYGGQARYRYRPSPEEGSGSDRCCRWFARRGRMGTGSEEADKFGCACGFASLYPFHATKGFVFERNCARETRSGKVYREDTGLCREEKGVKKCISFWLLDIAHHRPTCMNSLMALWCDFTGP